MFKFQINSGVGNGGEVIINTDNPEELSSYIASGDGFDEKFTEWLDGAQGSFGHFLDQEEIRPNDLDFALAQDPQVRYSLVEGELSDYSSPGEVKQSTANYHTIYSKQE